jgi:leader peptidase (prepilin peptidase) / N-methyltransferase
VSTLLENNPALLITLALLFGAIVGSFLNVAILRLPVMMQRAWEAEARSILLLPARPARVAFNLVTPGSHCGACGHAIKPWHNVPLLGWLWLRGRASCCGVRIGLRYPLVEALTALVSAACTWRFGLTPPLAAALAISWTLIALIVIDLDTMLLPDDLTLPLLWAGLLANLTGFGLAGVSLPAAVVGAIAGYLALWIVHQGYRLLTGKHGFGGGDFKLLAALGAWLGWAALPQIILLSSLVGSVVGISLMLVRGLKRDQPIPFGPYLAVAGWLAMMGVDLLYGLTSAP